MIEVSTGEPTLKLSLTGDDVTEFENMVRAVYQGNVMSWHCDIAGKILEAL